MTSNTFAVELIGSLTIVAMFVTWLAPLWAQRPRPVRKDAPTPEPWSQPRGWR